MTADRSTADDVTCPSCGGPVGVRATFCMHCGADLPDRVEYDDVTREADAGGESLLTRLRPGSTEQTETVEAASTDSIEFQPDESAGQFGAEDEASAASESRPGVPTGRGTDGPTLLPVDGLFDRSDDATRLLTGLAVLGVAGAVGLDLSLPVTGAALAMVAWAGSVVSMARHRSGFDAMRYGTDGLMVTLVFVSFALAYGLGGGGAIPFLLTLVPIGMATLFTAGFGYTMGESELL